jgi:hypothetical protein
LEIERKLPKKEKDARLLIKKNNWLVSITYTIQNP